MSEQTDREIIMDSAPCVGEHGHVKSPMHCGEKMLRDGGCSTGCCDDFKCAVCGHRVRVEWPD
jgi:hypothetical protein